MRPPNCRPQIWKDSPKCGIKNEWQYFKQSTKNCPKYCHSIRWWERMDYGPRTKKQSTGLFFPPAGGRAALISVSLPQIKILRRGTAKDFYLVGEDGFEPSKRLRNRFTVCPHWPLGNSPIIAFCFSALVSALLYYHEILYLSTLFWKKKKDFCGE